MYWISVLEFLVFTVIGIVALTEARSIVDASDDETAFEPFQLDQVRRALEDFRDSSDPTLNSGRPKCPCQKNVCKCCVRVNDPESGIQGNLCLLWVYFPQPRGVEAFLYVDSYFVFGVAVRVAILDHLAASTSCAQSSVTKGHTVCITMQLNGTTDGKNLSGCSNLLIFDSSRLNADFGCFSLNYARTKVDGATDASTFAAAEIQELFKTAEERILIRESILMKSNFPSVDDE